MPTQIDLRPLTGGEVPLVRQFAAEQVAPSDGDLQVSGPVRFSGRLAKKEERYQLTGHVSARLELACARCLEPFFWPVETDVDLTYVPLGAPDAEPDEEIELQDEDLNTAYYSEQVLDLGEMLREQFYLSLPMQPRCREDCRGLCPQCGVNRNLESCTCETRWQDPRLEALRALRKTEPQ
ncbi:MAG TPA: DUF177 domain-containing protein [Vicinamibacterales bacterium]